MLISLQGGSQLRTHSNKCMSKQIVNFARFFQIWSYTTSHRDLLFRSTKSPEHPTRIDILFKNVAHINLPTSFDGLLVSVLSEEEISNVGQGLGIQGMKERYVFSIVSANTSGFVVAGLVAWHEDQGEYSHASIVASGHFEEKTVWPNKPSHD